MLRGILHAGVDVSVDADQKQDALDVRLLDCNMKEIPALVVQLD